MEFLISVIVASLTVVGETAAKDAYTALKKRLLGRAKSQNRDQEVKAALDALESKPESAGRRMTLGEELAECGADRDEEILALAREIFDRIGRQAGGEQLIEQVVHGNRNIFSGSGDVSVRFGSPDPD